MRYSTIIKILGYLFKKHLNSLEFIGFASPSLIYDENGHQIFALEGLIENWNWNFVVCISCLYHFFLFFFIRTHCFMAPKIGVWSAEWIYEKHYFQNFQKKNFLHVFLNSTNFFPVLKQNASIIKKDLKDWNWVEDVQVWRIFRSSQAQQHTKTRCGHWQSQWIVLPRKSK